jgi:hypothetical protein
MMRHGQCGVRIPIGELDPSFLRNVEIVAGAHIASDSVGKRC